jgi:hypothetical protein
MTPPRTPTTGAGRKLLDAWRLVDEHGPPNAVVMRDAILAIEAEALAPLVDALRAADELSEALLPSGCRYWTDPEPVFALRKKLAAARDLLREVEDRDP